MYITWLPSLSSVIEKTAMAFRRFPLALLCAVFACGISIFLVHLDYGEKIHYPYLQNLLFTLHLGLNLFLASALFAESGKPGLKRKIGIMLMGFLLLAAYFFTLPETTNLKGDHFTRYLLFSLGLHSLVAFAPFTGKGSIDDFWQFNKALFLRFLTAALYSVVLYSGLALALLAIDNLFMVEIKGEWYMDLWLIIAMVFNTWFFLAGIPEKMVESGTEENYPKGLKVFTQFVLLPLVVIYLLILYAYTGKIIFQWELPQGWVSYLVISFSIAGILSLLLIYPIRNKKGNAWINHYSRWFYLALFPLIVMLFVAVGKRIADYGITEKRYFVLALALWLLGIATYFLSKNRQNIKIIPVSLCLLAFITSFGPWGAFSVSKNSQLGQFEKLLQEAGMLAAGKVKPAPEDISRKKAIRIVSVVRYLSDYHDPRELQPWFTMDIDSLTSTDSLRRNYNTEFAILQQIGLEKYQHIYRYAEKDDSSFYYYAGQQYSAIDVRSYDFLTDFNYSDYQGSLNNQSNSVEIDQHRFVIDYVKETESLRLKSDSLLLEMDIRLFIETLRARENQQAAQHTIDSDVMKWQGENEKMAACIYFKSISGTGQTDKYVLQNASGKLLIKLK